MRQPHRARLSLPGTAASPAMRSRAARRFFHGVQPSGVVHGGVQ
ncbi:hypothetical protein [Streptomyces bangladeshensis]